MRWVRFFLIIPQGCRPKAFTKGDYDDPNRVELLDDKFNEADMQQMADTVIKAMVACNYVANAPKPPIVIVERVQNRTEEHIDTVSMTDKIRTALIKSGKVRFVNKEERETISTTSTATTPRRQHRPGHGQEEARQADRRRLHPERRDRDQRPGSRQRQVHLPELTMNLTNLETSTIDCTDEKREVRKKFRKRSVGPQELGRREM